MRRNYRWVIIALIVVLIVINYIDRSAISYAIAPLTKTFGITNAQYGLISGAFSIGYLVFAFLSGPLVDRFGPKHVLLVAVLVWSIATALIPIAGSFAGLFLIRVLLGAGEGPGFPAGTRASSRWLPQHERGIALSLIGGVAVAGSLLIGGPIATQLIAHLGWRVMFITLAAVGFIWIALCLLLFQGSPQEYARMTTRERRYIEAGQIEEEKGSRQEKFAPAKILGNINLWMVALGFFAWGFIFWGFMYWLPAYLGDVYKLDITAVGFFSIAPWAAGVIGAILGGVIVDKLFIRTAKVRSRFIFMSIALLLAGASLIPVFVFPVLVVALTFISLGVGFGFLTGGTWWVAAIDAAPDQPASAAGFADAAFALAGLIAPAIMGFIVDATGSYSSGFILMAALAILGALGMLTFSKERRGRKALAPEMAEPESTT